MSMTCCRGHYFANFVQIKCETTGSVTEVPAHKFILGASSEVFAVSLAHLTHWSRNLA